MVTLAICGDNDHLHVFRQVYCRIKWSHQSILDDAQYGQWLSRVPFKVRFQW